MNVRTEKEEIDLLTAAVYHFAQAMKIKLIGEAKMGKRGWDGEHPETDLCNQIRSDSEEIYFENRPDLKPALSIDIANRAMMIWYRNYGKALIQAD